MGKFDNVVVTLDKNKVYSSYYAKACKIFPDWKLIAISRGIPDGFSGEIMRELNPPQQLLYEYKNKQCNDEEYIKRYYAEVLSNLNPYDIYNRVKGKVILCYCGKDSFCHRKLVVDWIRLNIREQAVGGEV